MGKRGEINPIYGITDAAFFGQFRSMLRKLWKNSQMHKDTILNARIPCIDGSKRKWVVPCAECNTSYYLNERIDVPRATGKGVKNVKAYQIDHKIDAGQLKSFDDISGFTKRLFCSSDGLQVLCYGCHAKKTYLKHKK